MAKLERDRYFTKIDLSKGYWQILMEKVSKENTAFMISDGCYQFKKMPFGMVNSAATFNRMMRKMLHDLCNIDHYVDDIMTHTVRLEDHAKTLRQLFERVREAGLTLQPSKC